MKPSLLVLLTGLLLVSGASVIAQQAPAKPVPAFAALTNVMTADIDPDAFKQWVDGAEGPISPAYQAYGMNILHELVWTRDLTKAIPSYPLGREVHFGDVETPGPRHLRIGFTHPIPVGTIIGGPSSQVSVLKPAAAYPGNMGDDSQWIPAQRLESSWNDADQKEELKVTSDEFGFHTKTAFWVLPPGTVTRAIRLTHVAKATDSTTFGNVAPICILPDRCIDAAGLATVAASTAQNLTPNLISTNLYGRWESNPNDASTNVVSPDHPDSLILAWPDALTLKGIILSSLSFANGDFSVYSGPATAVHDITMSSDWKQVADIVNPAGGAQWIDLSDNPKTRAVRLLMTQPIAPSQNTIAGHQASANGKLVAVNQIMAPMAIGDRSLDSFASAPSQTAASHPPIPIKFTLPEAGYVTLVIEDSTGKRVRNLISETKFPAGENTAWWDGMDDLGRDPEASQHSIYHVFGSWMPPGTYTVRGLYRKDVSLHYEFDVNNPGNPPWRVASGKGGWLADHTPPEVVTLIPGQTPEMAIGCLMAEGGDDLVTTDLDGNKKSGSHFVSGAWHGVASIASDFGDKPAGPHGSTVPAVFYWMWLDQDKSHNYTLSIHGWTDLKPNALGVPVRQTMNIFPLAGANDIVSPSMPNDPKKPAQPFNGNLPLGGFAVHNGLIALSFTPTDKIVFVDVAQSKIIGQATVPSPRGLAFDKKGRLLVVSGTNVLRFPAPDVTNVAPPPPAPPAAPPVASTTNPASGSPGTPAAPAPIPAPPLPVVTLGAPETLVSSGLDNPYALALDGSDAIYVTDWANSNQVKVFTPQGKPVRTIGHAGPATPAGPYDKLHMNYPKGVAVDTNGRVWVTEACMTPKRVSVWNTDGTLYKAFYGPDEYAGGGSIDPKDKTLFYYRDMQFKLDWDKGTSEPVAIMSPPSSDAIGFHGGMWHWLGRPVYYNGRRYLTDSFQSGVDANGAPITYLFTLNNGVAQPVAAVGQAERWPMLMGNTYRKAVGWPTLDFDYGTLWPPEFTPVLDNPPKPGQWPGHFVAGLLAANFAWSDLNGDGKLEPNEVKIIDGNYGPEFTLQDDLSIISSYGVQIAPQRFTDQGAPVYDITKTELLLPTGTAKEGNDQILLDKNGWMFMTTAPNPFPGQSLGGAKDGKPMWSYPNLWPGIHPSHVAPPPTFPGELVGASHLMGGFFTPKNSDAGPMVALNSNMGNVYVFTSDGLYVATLFRNVWQAGPWAMPHAERNMDVTEMGHWTEDFLPTINETDDGSIYIVCEPQHSSIVRVDGLESVRRIAPMKLEITPELLAQAEAYNLQTAASRIAQRGRDSIDVPILPAPPALDGKLDAWNGADWATIDTENDAMGDWGSTTKVNRAALAVSGDRLYAAFDVHNTNLLVNADDDLKALFKTGGALDIMIGANPDADPKRANPVEGDIRLLVAQKTTAPNKKTTVAAVFRAVVPGTKNPVPFSSPWRTITFDAVDDVSSQVQLVAGPDGSYELSIPLSVLGLHPTPGQVIRGDIGILRGNGFQTIRRSYWQNKATGLVADVPGEAQLTPQLWGSFKFVAPASAPATTSTNTPVVRP